MLTFASMIRLKNNTKQVSKIGYLCVIDPNDKNAFVNTSSNATNILGVITESVPYRADCDIATSGETLIYVNANIQQGDIIRSRKGSDTFSNGSSTVAKPTDAPYLQVGIARTSGNGLVKAHLIPSYIANYGVDTVADGIYTIGLGISTDGVITVKNGLVTTIIEAT